MPLTDCPSQVESIADRQLELEHYLQALLACPKLRRHPHVLTFVGVDVGMSLDATVSSSDSHFAEPLQTSRAKGLADAVAELVRDEAPLVKSKKSLVEAVDELFPPETAVATAESLRPLHSPFAPRPKTAPAESVGDDDRGDGEDVPAADECAERLVFALDSESGLEKWEHLTNEVFHKLTSISYTSPGVISRGSFCRRLSAPRHLSRWMPS